MSDDFTTLDGTLDAAWARLEAAMTDAASPARHIALATADLSAGASVRMVVLRAVDRAAGRLALYSHTEAAKVAELEAEPTCELLVWDALAQFQIRLRGTASVRPGPDAIWDNMAGYERRLYAGSPGPGQQMDEAEDLTTYPPTPDQGYFTLIDVALDQIETLHLTRDLHRRTSFRPIAEGGGWDGIWIVP